MANVLLLLLFIVFGAAPAVSYKEVDDKPPVCGVWFAKSTIPGAGLGIFAGKDVPSGQSVLPVGDVVIPIVDISVHIAHLNANHFLWDDYKWNGAPLFMEHEGVSREINIASPGLGAAVNCVMDLINVEEGIPPSNNLGMHRSNDPGAGAFSYYWNRDTVALVPIQAGSELFAECK